MSERHAPAPLSAPADAPSDLPRTNAVVVMDGDVGAATSAMGGRACTLGGLGPRTEGLVAQPASESAKTARVSPCRNTGRNDEVLRYCFSREQGI